MLAALLEDLSFSSSLTPLPHAAGGVTTAGGIGCLARGFVPPFPSHSTPMTGGVAMTGGVRIFARGFVPPFPSHFTPMTGGVVTTGGVETFKSSYESSCELSFRMSCEPNVLQSRATVLGTRLRPPDIFIFSHVTTCS